MESHYRLLRNHIENIVPLKDGEFQYVISCFTYECYKKGELIIAESEIVKHVYFVLSGLLKLVYTDSNAKQHVVSFAMEDWWETDFQAYYTQGKANLTLECIEDTQVLCLSFLNFEKVCSDLQKMERFFLRKSIAGHISSQQRILSFMTSSAMERYEQLIDRNPSLIQRVPKSLLASYLGVSRETLSRIFLN